MIEGDDVVRFGRCLFGVFALILAAGAAWTSPLQSPTDRPILVVSGAISNANTSDKAAFDHAMLRNLDWVEVETFTSFTDGAQVFAGPTLQSVLDAVGARGETLHASAINDYTVQIPVAHAQQHEVILAVEHNGRPMRIRDKGPIWVVYPLSEAAAAMRPFDGEMIWQLTRIRVE